MPVSPSLTLPPTVVQRLPRLLVGLVSCGVGIALSVRSNLGLGPWDVLHQGISRRTGIPIGMVGILVGLVVLVAWLPLRERIGIGTAFNVVVIGVTIDLVLLVVTAPAGLIARSALAVIGLLLFAVGSGFYIGAGLGAGPRDGLMTALARRGWHVGRVRTGLELATLVVGWLLGGTVGVGTLAFALGIGPLVHVLLPRLAVDDAYLRRGRRPAETAAAA